MGKQVTIVLDEKLLKKIRSIQTKKMQRTNKSVSFSKTVSELLEQRLK